MLAIQNYFLHSTHYYTYKLNNNLPLHNTHKLKKCALKINLIIARLQFKAVKREFFFVMFLIFINDECRNIKNICWRETFASNQDKLTS